MLGAAKIAPSALITPAAAIDGVQITAVAARDPLRGQSFAQKHSIERVFDDYDHLLSDPQVDAVYIALPAALHARWMVAAIDAGKHVLCEKPFTSNAEAAERVAVAGDASDVVVMEAYHSAYHPLQAQLRQILASGELGRVISARAVFCIPLLSRKAIQWNAELGGGGLLDVGYYPLRQLRDLFGEPTEILDARAWASHDVDRRLDAHLGFADGVRGEIITAIMSPRRLLTSSLEIRGDAGRLRVTAPYAPQYGARISLHTSRGRRGERADRRPSYIFQLEAFRDAVRGGVRPLTGPREAVAQLTAIDHLYTAAGMAPRPSAP